MKWDARQNNSVDLLHNEINPVTQLQRFFLTQYHIMFMLSTDALEHNINII